MYPLRDRSIISTMTRVPVNRFVRLTRRLFAAPHPPAAPERLLYHAVVAQARRPEFHACAGVPDNLDGRFELLAVHAFLVLHRLKELGPEGRTLAQRLFDIMFADLDESLRELGVGDMGIGRRIKFMAKGFYGRIGAYDRALAAQGGELAKALARNLYGTLESPPEALAAMAEYMHQAVRRLAIRTHAELAAGNPDFPEPPGSAGSEG
jgi:cytochrome b pre-mRNA-processing protein 3